MAGADVKRRTRRAAGRAKRAILRNRAPVASVKPKPAKRGVPLLSVVMPVYNVELYVEEALRSVLSQSLSSLEVVVIDDGSTDGSAAIVKRLARADRRVRYVRQENAGLGAARNSGSRRARGTFIAFVDSDDVVPQDAFKKLVTTLQDTGSEIATGNVRRFHGKKEYQSWNQSQSHALDLRRVTLDEHPALALDTTAWNKVFNREFWDAHRLEFAEGRLYEDMVTVTRAFTLADSIDVLSAPTYRWRVRDTQDSITQRRGDLSNLRDKTDMMRECISVVSGSVELERTLRIKGLEADLWVYVDHLGHDPSFDELFERTVKDLWDVALLDATSRLPFDQTLFFSVCETYGWQRAQEVRAWLRHHRQDLRTELQDGVARVVPPEELGLDELPANVWVMRQLLKPVVTVTDLRWQDDELVVRGWGYLEFLGDVENHVLELRLEGEDGAMPLQVEREWRADVNRWNRSAEYDASSAGFIVRVRASDLAAATDGTRSLIATLRYQGLAFELPVTRIWQGGSARAVPSVTVGPRRALNVTAKDGRGVKVTLREHSLVARRASIRSSRVEMHLTDSGEHSVVDAWMTYGKTAIRAPGSITAVEGGLRITFELPVVPFASRTAWAVWRVRAKRADGRIDGVFVPDPTCLENERGSSLSVVRHFEGAWLEVPEKPRVVKILAVNPGQGEVRLTGSVPLSGAVSIALRDVASGDSVWREPIAPDESGHFRVTVPLRKHGSVPLPLGNYRLVASYDDDRHSDPWLVAADIGLISELPLVATSDIDGIEVNLGPRHGIDLRVVTPLNHAERGHIAQKRLRTAVVPVGNADGLTVFASSFSGNSAGCHPLPVALELAKREGVANVAMEVTDHSVVVPDDIRPVIRWSREWWETIRSADVIVSNTTLPRPFAKRSGQLYVQTWHGTPLKRIGTDIKRAVMSREWLDHAEREAQQSWDLLLSVSPFTSSIFPSALAFAGPVAEVGSPRLDALARDDRWGAAEVREELGISRDRRILLYAPTWRDDRRTSELLDVEQFRRAFGQEWTLVVRAHPNVLGSREKAAISRGPHIVDASRYPVIEKLYGAADALVTDYSSVMFDFAVTGRPQMFLAPDLDWYRDEARGFYVEYEETVPGPVHASTKTLLAQLPEVLESDGPWGARREEFRARFAPLEDGAASARLVDRILAER